MKSSSKMVVTGAVGGLAAVVVAASGAFACTADATVGIFQTGVDSPMAEKPIVRPGQKVTIGIRAFQAGKPITINWMDPFMGTVTPLTQFTQTYSTQEFTIPTDLYDSLGKRPYYLQAIQSGTYTRSREVYVTGGKIWTAPLPPPLNPHVEPAPVAPAPTPATDIGVTPDGAAPQVAAAAPLSGTTQAAATVAAVNSTPPPDQVASTAGIVPTQPASAPIPVSPPAPPENNAPPAGELWSGLRADGSGNLLEPAAGTNPPSGGAPAGGIALLGMGILSLAGVAFEATRRRLVLSKVTRRR